MGDFVDLLGDGRLLKRPVRPGAGAAPTAAPSAHVAVRYETRVVTDGPLGPAGEVIDSCDELFDFTLGSEDVLEAWTLAVRSMTCNEKSIFRAHPDLTYGQDGCGDDVPPGSWLEFAIHLFPEEGGAAARGPDTKKEPKAGRERQRLERAQEAKEQGNLLTKCGEFHAARKAYKEALMLMKFGDAELEKLDVTTFDQLHQLRLSCCLNLAMCDLKVEDFSTAIESATNALALDPQNCKALYRRGVAYLHQGQLDGAKMDFMKAFETEPTAEIRRRLEECHKKLTASNQWHKNAFGGMFQKAPEQLVRARDLSLLPQVWLVIQIGDGPSYRFSCALYSDTVPRTAENFRCLCTGERGVSRSGQALQFRGSLVHKVVPRCLIEAGDITKSNGMGGESIYGPKFADENFADLHHKKGLLSMVNHGQKDANSSQFMVTLRSLPEFDGRNVVFGEVLGSLEALEAVEQVATEYPDRPKTPIRVVACGES